MSSNAEYGGAKGPAPSAIIKSFNLPIEPIIWNQKNNKNKKYPNLGSPVIFPTSTSISTSVFVPGDLQVNGTIYGTVQSIPSDFRIKENINTISLSLVDKLLLLEPKEFKYVNESDLHYGFVAQSVETHFPNLVSELYMPKYETPMKTINYLELIPLLVAKVQNLQHQIDELKRK